MKKQISFCLCLLLILSLCGCSGFKKKHTDEMTIQDNEIYLYIVKDLKVMPAENKYQLKNPDSVSASVEEVLSALVLAFEGELAFYTYMLDDSNNVTLDVNLGCAVEQEELLAVQSAICSTLFQVEAVDNIQLTIHGLETEVLSQEVLKRESFYYYDNEYDNLNLVTRIIYVSNETKDGLNRIAVNVQRTPEKSDQELVVEKMLELGYLPAGTKVNMVSTRGDICTIDINSEFNGSVGGLPPEIELYGVVNSVLEQTDATKVQILIDGMVIDKYRNAVDISEPLTFNSELVK